MTRVRGNGRGAYGRSRSVNPSRSQGRGRVGPIVWVLAVLAIGIAIVAFR